MFESDLIVSVEVEPLDAGEVVVEAEVDLVSVRGPGSKLQLKETILLLRRKLRVFLTF